MTAGTLLGSGIALPPPVISTASRESVGLDLVAITNAAFASAVWPATRRVVYVPLHLNQQVTITLVWWLNGATVGTNKVDCGVYSSASGLPVTKLISNGTATTSAGASVVQSVDVADTIVGPGLYFLALSFDGTTDTSYRAAPTLAMMKTLGMCQETPGVFGLPTTATPIALTSAYLPLFGLATVTTI